VQVRSICFLLVWLFILTNTAYAASWSFIGRSQAFNQYFNEYVDKDTAVKDGNKVFYWVLQIFDKPDVIGTKKMLWKCEAVTQKPQQMRTLENYYYDIDSNETYHDATVGAYNPVDNKLLSKEIGFAKKYAKETSGGVQKPALP
jgi:hypothetical protein